MKAHVSKNKIVRFAIRKAPDLSGTGKAGRHPRALCSRGSSTGLPGARWPAGAACRTLPGLERCYHADGAAYANVDLRLPTGPPQLAVPTADQNGWAADWFTAGNSMATTVRYDCEAAVPGIWWPSLQRRTWAGIRHSRRCICP